MITSPLSPSTLFNPFFPLGEQNMGDLPPNAASPTQAHQSWMRRWPHAVVGGGLCQDLDHVSHTCLFLVSFFYRTGQDGHERVKTKSIPLFYPVTCTLFLQLASPAPPQKTFSMY